MIDWTKPMSQSYAFYEISPITWEDTEMIETVASNSGSITRDLTTDTLSSASFDVLDMSGEKYIRAYLICEQNGEMHRECLGTFLLQSPEKTFNGIKHSISVNAYSPLIELKEKYPTYCYTIEKGRDVVPLIIANVKENMRATVINSYTKQKITDYDLMASTTDTWMDYMVSVLNQNKLSYKMDPYGKFELYEQKPIDAMTPVWTFDDSDSSILFKDIRMTQDLYGVPNVVEVYISTAEGYSMTRVVNDDPNSPTSTIARGREIVYRDTSPDIIGIPTTEEIQKYAERKLKNLSTITVELSYTHAYCPVTIGDCVRINYVRAGITDVKALVTQQSIRMDMGGCTVTEVAKFTSKLWR